MMMQMLIIVVLQFLYICNCDAFSRVKLSCQDLSCSSRIAATLSSFPSFFYKSRKATALRSRFLSDATKERIRNGKISAKEIDRIYEPSNSDRDKIMYPLSKGFVGVVFALEGSLLHLEAVLAYTWAIFAADIGKPGPSLSTVKDIIGLDFSESVLALGWTLDLTDMDRYEKRYYEILNLMIDKVPSAVREGSADLIESIINDQNKITVVTTFPREIATKLLRITKLARIFEERNINPECLIHPDQQSMWMIPGQTHFGKLMVRSLSVMEKPSILTILIDSNRRNILVAKRLGISCIAMKGNAANVQYLRAADHILDSFNKLPVKEIYKIVKKSLKQAEGPDQETAPSLVMEKVTLKPVSSAYSDDEKRPKDTFAEEMGSDQM